MSEVDDLVLISVDDHVIEPTDLFVHHLSAAYQDRAPKLVRAPEELRVEFARYGVSAEHARKMTHENTMRWFSFDPFAQGAKEDATVGALRRRAAGHDVSIMSLSTRVRTADEKLEGLRCRARRAVAAAAT